MSETRMSPRRRAAEDFAMRLFRLFLAVVGLAILAEMGLRMCWEWLIPDLLPGAVAEGLVAPTLSAWTTFKLAGAVAAVTTVWRYVLRRSAPGGADLPLLAAKLDAILRHLEIDPAEVLRAEVVRLVREGKTIPAIALHRSATGADSATAKAYVETLRHEDGSPQPGTG
jgi:hypothetical protein